MFGTFTWIYNTLIGTTGMLIYHLLSNSFWEKSGMLLEKVASLCAGVGFLPQITHCSKGMNGFQFCLYAWYPSYPGYILASTCKEEQESLLLWTPFCFRGSQHHSGPVLLILKFLFQFSLGSITLLHSWVERGSIRKCGKCVLKPCWIIRSWANQLVFFCSSHMCRLSTFLSSHINNCCGLCPLLPFPYLSCIILSRPVDTRGFPLLISNSLIKLSTVHHSCHYMGNTVTKG